MLLAVAAMDSMVLAMTRAKYLPAQHLRLPHLGELVGPLEMRVQGLRRQSQLLVGSQHQACPLATTRAERKMTPSSLVN